MSTIITNDEYSVSKMSSASTDTQFDEKLREPKRKLSCNVAENQFTVLKTSSTMNRNDSERKVIQSKGGSSKIAMKNELGVQELPTYQSGSHVNTGLAEERPQVEKADKSIEATLKPSLKPKGTNKLGRSITWADEKTDSSLIRNLCEVREIEDMNLDMDKLSLNRSGAKKVSYTLTQDTERIESSGSGNLCDIRELEDGKDASDVSCSKYVEEKDNMLRFALAEACAMALGEASDAVASGGSDVTDASTSQYAYSVLYETK